MKIENAVSLKPCCLKKLSMAPVMGSVPPTEESSILINAWKPSGVVMAWSTNFTGSTMSICSICSGVILMSDFDTS